MATLLAVTKSDLANIARSAANARKGRFATLDYSGLKSVGAMVAYTDDLDASDNIVALDPTNDTPDTEKKNTSERRRVLGNIVRNARTALKNDNADFRAFWADVPTPTKENEQATTRHYIVERVK